MGRLSSPMITLAHGLHLRVLWWGRVQDLWLDLRGQGDLGGRKEEGAPSAYAETRSRDSSGSRGITCQAILALVHLFHLFVNIIIIFEEIAAVWSAIM